MASGGAKTDWKQFIWPAIGLTTIALSFWLLGHELRDMSWSLLWQAVLAVPPAHWLMIAGCTVTCYLALSAYDLLALQHLGRCVPFRFVLGCSLTTYSLSHILGASTFTGALIRYRAYSSKGLGAAEVGVLVAFCSLTFSIGVMVLLALSCLMVPSPVARISSLLSPGQLRLLGVGLLAVVALYLAASARGLPDLKIRRFTLSYPRLSIAARQALLGPVELSFAAAILYFALPAAGNPGFLIVLGVFAMGFTLAILSHAPGGIGVFELVVITGLPEFPPEVVLAGLLVFRIFYFLIPLAMGMVMIAYFERGQLRLRRH